MQYKRRLLVSCILLSITHALSPAIEAPHDKSGRLLTIQSNLAAEALGRKENLIEICQSAVAKCHDRDVYQSLSMLCQEVFTPGGGIQPGMPPFKALTDFFTAHGLEIYMPPKTAEEKSYKTHAILFANWINGYQNGLTSLQYELSRNPGSIHFAPVIAAQPRQLKDLGAHNLYRELYGLIRGDKDDTQLLSQLFMHLEINKKASSGNTVLAFAQSMASKVAKPQGDILPRLCHLLYAIMRHDEARVEVESNAEKAMVGMWATAYCQAYADFRHFKELLNIPPAGYLPFLSDSAPRAAFPTPGKTRAQNETEKAHGGAGFAVGRALAKEHVFLGSPKGSNVPAHMHYIQGEDVINAYRALQVDGSAFYCNMDAIIETHMARDREGLQPGLQSLREKLGLEDKELITHWLADVMYIYYHQRGLSQRHGPQNFINIIYDFTMGFFDTRQTNITTLCVLASAYLLHKVERFFPHSSHRPDLIAFVAHLRHWLTGFKVAYADGIDKPARLADLAGSDDVLSPPEDPPAKAHPCPPPTTPLEVRAVTREALMGRIKSTIARVNQLGAASSKK